MNFLIHVHALTVAIAISYVTLLAANQPVAEGACLWIYASVMVVLTFTCLATERHHCGR